jgi:hypothetical protein
MLQQNQEERATAKELKNFIKLCNISDDTIMIKNDKIETFWNEESNNKNVNLFKTKKYIFKLLHK